jgi:hypothetical protein
MVKLFALMSLFAGMGSGEYRIAKETPVPERVAPTPYAADGVEAKAAAIANSEDAAKIKYAYAEINRLRAQLADAVGRLEESRRDHDGLRAMSNDQDAELTRALRINGALLKNLSERDQAVAASNKAKAAGEIQINDLKNSSARAWGYCTILALGLIVVLIFVMSFTDWFRAIMARLPDKEKDDRIAELEIELSKRLEAVIDLDLLTVRYAASRVKRKRAGKMVAELLRDKSLAAQRNCGLLDQIDRLARQFNGLRLVDLRFRDGRIEVLQRLLEDADLKIAARDEDVKRYVNFQDGSERTIERITFDAFEMLNRVVELEKIVVSLRQALDKANGTIAALNGGIAQGKASPGEVLPEDDKTPPVTIGDAAAIIDEAERNALRGNR